jgi:hypothetical protein
MQCDLCQLLRLSLGWIVVSLALAVILPYVPIYREIYHCVIGKEEKTVTNSDCCPAYVLNENSTYLNDMILSSCNAAFSVFSNYNETYMTDLQKLILNDIKREHKLWESLFQAAEALEEFKTGDYCFPGESECNSNANYRIAFGRDELHALQLIFNSRLVVQLANFLNASRIAVDANEFLTESLGGRYFGDISSGKLRKFESSYGDASIMAEFYWLHLFTTKSLTIQTKLHEDPETLVRQLKRGQDNVDIANMFDEILRDLNK